MSSRVLVAGLGNIFLGDDGFGVEVVRRLGDRALPGGVEVADIGIRGVHLAFDLLDGVDLLILADAAPHGAPPGTVSVIEAALPAAPANHSDPENPAGPENPGPANSGGPMLMDAHDMRPDAVLGLLGALGAPVGRAVIIACEPACVDPGIGLSPRCAAGVDAAVAAIERIVTERERTPC